MRAYQDGNVAGRPFTGHLYVYAFVTQSHQNTRIFTSVIVLNTVSKWGNRRCRWWDLQALGSARFALSLPCRHFARLYFRELIHVSINSRLTRARRDPRPAPVLSCGRTSTASARPSNPARAPPAAQVPADVLSMRNRRPRLVGQSPSKA